MRRLGACVHGSENNPSRRGVEVDRGLCAVFFGETPRRIQPGDPNQKWYKRQRTDTEGLQVWAEELMELLTVPMDVVGTHQPPPPPPPPPPTPPSLTAAAANVAGSQRSTTPAGQHLATAE